jgi:hypothetical protein
MGGGTAPARLLYVVIALKNVRTGTRSLPLLLNSTLAFGAHSDEEESSRPCHVMDL